MSKVESTTTYKMFKLRDDNRTEINKSHVQRLVNSIKSNNMLAYRPIDVNSQMEVIDGQHRLKAAEQLGVPIFYRVLENSQEGDVIVLNVAKTWLTADYMNYYLKNQYPEYLKLQDFIKRTGLTLKVALSIVIGYTHDAYTKFKEGKMIYQEENIDHELEICLSTVEYIKKMTGNQTFLNTIKFWRPMIKMVRDPNFRLAKWTSNLSKLVNRVTARATERDFLELFQSIHNYRNTDKINIVDFGDQNISD